MCELRGKYPGEPLTGRQLVLADYQLPEVVRSEAVQNSLQDLEEVLSTDELRACHF